MSKTTMFCGSFGTSTVVVSNDGSWSSAAVFRSQVKETVAASSAAAVSVAVLPSPQADSARTADSGRARAVNGRAAVRIVLHSEFGQGCLT
jgi:hypothetical protein